MGKKYDIQDDKVIVDFCLNCTEKVCNGNCDKLITEKHRRQAELKGRRYESNRKIR
jgi:hypothetical protein